MTTTAASPSAQLGFKGGRLRLCLPGSIATSWRNGQRSGVSTRAIL